MSYAKGLQAYQKSQRDGLELGTQAQWVGALLDEVLLCCQLSINAIGTQNISVRGVKTSKAISILNEGLIPALNPAQGGDIAQNLFALYSYCATLLFEANRLADVAKYQECRQLISDVREGWRAVEQLPA